MLTTNYTKSEDQFAEALERYLGEVLHEHFHVRPFEYPRSLPSFVSSNYILYETRILGRQCVIIAKHHNLGTPADIAKHVEIVRNKVNATTVFATTAISAHNRSRLIGQAVPFIVPGNQLYIPDLAIDLREHFRAPKNRQTENLSPAAQAVLFQHILYPDSQMTTPSFLAGHLGYSAMSIGRAFDDLAAVGLAKTIKHGKERHIRFNAERRQLLEEATPLLRSPVRSLKYVYGNALGARLKLAGETALSYLTELAGPSIVTVACASRDWKTISRSADLVEVHRDEANCFIETWSYDPAALSDSNTVDVLSLYTQFRDHRDERVAMAADRLLEKFPW